MIIIMYIAGLLVGWLAGREYESGKQDHIN